MNKSSLFFLGLLLTFTYVNSQTYNCPDDLTCTKCSVVLNTCEQCLANFTLNSSGQCSTINVTNITNIINANGTNTTIINTNAFNGSINNCSDANCAFCPNKTCETCNFGFLLNSSNSCISANSTPLIILACTPNCSTCNNGTCLECDLGFTLSANKTCNLTQGNPRCDVLNCAQCAQSNLTCAQCNEGFFFNPIGFCQFCPVNCGQCTNEHSCNICFNNFSIVNGFCVQNNANTTNNTGTAPGTSIFNNTANNNSANANGGIISGVGGAPQVNGANGNNNNGATNNNAKDGDQIAVPLIAIISGLIALF